MKSSSHTNIDMVSRNAQIQFYAIVYRSKIEKRKLTKTH